MSAAESPDRAVLVCRLVTALVQAAVLYLLVKGITQPFVWFVKEPHVFAPLLLVCIYAPLLVMLGLGQLPARPLAAWAALAALVVAGLGYHDAARGQLSAIGTNVLWPTSPLWLALSIAVFVAHVLVIDAIAERRLVSSYGRHFNTAWKLGLQLCLTFVFVGVFWLVLALGAGLFQLLGLGGFGRFIVNAWFMLPATTLATAVSLHITDVQPALIRGVRGIVLALFSWLLPLLALIVLGFLCSLVFTSLAPLWKTRFATVLLLVSAVALIFLINSTYQDGGEASAKSRVKRAASVLGTLELVPLVGLAAWALALRVDQYGWTAERIVAAAAIALVACYAVGYAVAVVRMRAWLRGLEPTNVIAAYAFLALVAALFTPIADPARLMVASQVERLRAGRIAVEKFDFAALKFDGARWGMAALLDMSRNADGPDGPAVRAKALVALSMASRYANPNVMPPNAAELARHIDVEPAGKTLPAVFYDNTFWTAQHLPIPTCARNQGQVVAPCVARFMALRPDAPEAILFFDHGMVPQIFETDAAGNWRRTAILNGRSYCAKLEQSLRQGDIQIEPHPWSDLIVGGVRMTVDDGATSCPP